MSKAFQCHWKYSRIWMMKVKKSWLLFYLVERFVKFTCLYYAKAQWKITNAINAPLNDLELYKSMIENKKIMVWQIGVLKCEVPDIKLEVVSIACQIKQQSAFLYFHHSYSGVFLMPLKCSILGTLKSFFSFIRFL